MLVKNVISKDIVCIYIFIETTDVLSHSRKIVKFSFKFSRKKEIENCHQNPFER